MKNQVIDLGTVVATLPYPVLVGGADRNALSAFLGADRPSLTVKVGRTNLDERLLAWEEKFKERNWDLSKTVELAERFYSVGGTTIDQIMERAIAESGGNEPDEDTLWAAARECSRPESQGLALHVVPRYKWDDLILPNKTKDQIQHLINCLAEQETVYHRWGASKVRARGYGIKALFSGGPGTGNHGSRSYRRNPWTRYVSS